MPPGEAETDVGKARCLRRRLQRTKGHAPHTQPLGRGRDYRDALAACNNADHGLGSGRFVRDRRIETGETAKRLQIRVDVEAARRLIGDEPTGIEGVNSDGAAVNEQRMAKRKRDDQGLAVDEARLDQFVENRQPDDADIDLARAQRLDLVKHRHSVKDDLDFGGGFAEASYQRGDQRVDSRSAEANIEGPAQPLGGTARALRSVVQDFQSLACVGYEYRARRRERNMVLVTIEQACADLVLKFADRPAERGLRDVAPLRRPGEVQLLGDSYHISHLAQIHRDISLV